MEKPVPKSQFKAKALAYLRGVEASGKPLLVADHGKPTIEVRRYRAVERAPLDILKGTVVDYVGPLDAVGAEDWEALQ